MSTLLEEFKSVTEALNSAGIEYAVCGGWAMAIHGLPRSTIEIDLLITTEDLERVWEIAKGNGYDVEGLPLHFGAIEIRRISRMDPETNNLFTLDLLLVTRALGDILRKRELVEWGEGRAWVVSKSGLIELKRISGRDQDMVDIKRLEGE
jgi:hypothetical protein